MEHARIDPLSLSASPTGVYLGLTHSPYAPGVYENAPEGLADYLSTGTVGNAASGRVAYALDLKGPALTVDTACSSSLVALHLAARALRAGDCTMALAGGVSFMATPYVFTEFRRRQGLAADGRCKSFAAAADGMGFAEGVGVLLLERLSDARRAGHRVLALVRGSAVGQDGTTNGLAAPNGLAQQQVIRQALADAGLPPDAVDAVEAHGSGSVFGDPVEAEALIAVYGKGRPADRPLLLGSYKSNVGHAAAAAGVGGVIKTVMALRHGRLPKTLHVDRPTPHVDWSAGAVSLLTESVPWPDTGRPRRAGVTAIGASGTNAHVILEQAPPGAGPAARGSAPAAEGSRAEPGPLPWVVSGRTPDALRAQAERLAALLDADPAPEAGRDPADLGYALAVTRSAFRHRAVLVAERTADFRAGLAALAAGEPAACLVTGRRVTGGTAVFFPGPPPGADGLPPDAWRALAARFPVFRRALDEVCALLDARLGDRLGRPLRALSPGGGDGGGDGGGPLPDDRDTWAGAVLFAGQTALYRLAEACGLTPGQVAGTGLGEVAAAHAAG
ncbi:type I polyketide synthase, partial [Streptomyces sp. YIM 98790]|uniref:type I polyketide synthase n=1 Tax=Streptomyces sp. YIM 98790 TaxID=2689077 RepID=UPI0028BEEDB5